MNNDLISREALKKALKSNCDLCHDKNTNWCEHCCPLNDFEDLIDNAPTVYPICEDKACKYRANERPQGEFSRKDLESWLYQIAMNNIGTDFEKSVVEIIHRLDGFERFVSEQKGGAE